jgi:hypothetical protein
MMEEALLLIGRMDAVDDLRIYFAHGWRSQWLDRSMAKLPRA